MRVACTTPVTVDAKRVRVGMGVVDVVCVVGRFWSAGRGAVPLRACWLVAGRWVSAFGVFVLAMVVGDVAGVFAAVFLCTRAATGIRAVRLDAALVVGVVAGARGGANGCADATGPVEWRVGAGVAGRCAVNVG